MEEDEREEESNEETELEEEFSEHHDDDEDRDEEEEEWNPASGSAASAGDWTVEDSPAWLKRQKKFWSGEFPEDDEEALSSGDSKAQD